MYFRIYLLLLCVAVNSVHGNHGNLSTTDPTAMGIAVSGGNPAYSSVEVYVPSTGQSCSLPPLPLDREAHTMDNLYICGGESTYPNVDYTKTSCLHFSSGRWTTHYTMVDERSYHTSWWTDQGLVLMGGWESPDTTEIVPTNGGQGGPSFPMKYSTWHACAIPDTTSGSVVITGGGYYTREVVSRYDMQGHVEDLPQLRFGREDHGCGSYMREDGTQVLLVTGGYSANTGYLLSNTEVLTTDSTAWTMAGPLPSALTGIRCVTLGNTLYATGGYDGRYEGEVLEWRDEDQEWVEQGTLQKTRGYHYMSTIQLEGEVMDHCD